MNLFVYGTLMDDALVAELTGRRFPKYSACLSGYRKHMRADGYPYIVPDAQGEVAGVLLCEVDAEALRAFDEYEDEGRLYRRVEVTLPLAGSPVCAFAYVNAR